MKYVVCIYARHTQFSKEAEAYLKSLEDRTKNPKIKKWISGTLRKYLRDQDSLKLLTKEQYDEIPNPETYVTRSFEERDAYFADVKDISRLNGIPCELLVDYVDSRGKAGISIPDLIKAFEVSHKNGDPHTTKEIRGYDIDTIIRYKNGWRWVKLKSQFSFIREGALMLHCMGGYDHYQQSLSGEITACSLRDAKNKPLITLDFANSTKVLNQVKGRNLPLGRA